MKDSEIKEEDRIACIFFRIAEHQTCMLSSFVTQDSELMSSCIST